MKDKYNSIITLDGLALRIEILRRFFNLAKDNTIIHEITIASDDLLRNFVLEYKWLSRELNSRVRMREILIGLLYLVIFIAQTRWLPESLHSFISKRYKFLLNIYRSSHRKSYGKI